MVRLSAILRKAPRARLHPPSAEISVSPNGLVGRCARPRGHNRALTPERLSESVVRRDFVRWYFIRRCREKQQFLGLPKLAKKKKKKKANTEGAIPRDGCEAGESVGSSTSKEGVEGGSVKIM